MRIVLIAIGLVVLMAVGWIVNGLMSDREEEELAVHYSWIVKWALTLSRETGGTPDRAMFDSPRIQVAGHPHRWLVSGRMNWRDSEGQEVGEQYSAVVENICKAYADPKCWRLDGFATGEAGIDLAESTLAASETQMASAEQPDAAKGGKPGSEPQQAEPAPEVQQAGVQQAGAAEQPERQSAPTDPVIALLDEETQPVAEDPAGTALADGAVPAAPVPPIADGVPIPERKPPVPMRLGDEDTLVALDEPTDRTGEADSLAVLDESPPPLTSEEDNAAVLAEAGPVTTNADSAFAVADSQAIATNDDSDAAVAEAAVPGAEGDTQAALADVGIGEESAVALAEAGVAASTGGTAAASEYEPAATGDAVGGAGDQLAVATATVPAPASVPPSSPPLPAPLPEPTLASPTTPVPAGNATAGQAPASAAPPAATAVAALPAATAVAALPAPRAPAPSAVAALPPPEAPAPVEPGEDPAVIVLIQDRLDRAGYDPGPIDGRFGGRTQAALMQFERDAGLPVKGQPSREALAALDHSLGAATAARAGTASQVAAVPSAAAAQPSAPAPSPAPPQPAASAAPVSPVAALPASAPARTTAPAAPAPANQPVNLMQPAPSQAPAVAADESLIFLIQHRLRQAGFSPGRFDGRMSDGTASAIRAYQQKSGLPANGVPSRALLERLETDVLNSGQKQPLTPTPLGFVSCGAAGQPSCAPPPA